MLPLRLTTALLLLIGFLACSEKKDNSLTAFPKPPARKLDSVFTWLGKRDNYFNADYLPTFYRHFKKQIEQNKLDSAAQLLNIARTNISANNSSDSMLIQTTLDFLAQYENRISLRFRSSLYNRLGSFYTDMADFDKSRFFYEKNNFVPIDYYTAFNIVLSNEGMMYYFSNMTQYDSAIIYGQKTLDFYEKHKNWVGLYNIYAGLFNCYDGMEDEVMAEKNINLAIEYARKSKDSSIIAKGMMAKADFLYEIESPRLSLYIDSLELFIAEWKPRDPYYGIVVEVSKGIKYLEKGKMEEVEKIIKHLGSSVRDSKDEDFTDHYVALISHYEVACKKPLSNEQYVLDAIEKSKKTKDFYGLSSLYALLSENAVIKKDDKAALAYYKEQVKVEDSLRNNKIRYEANELDKKYQTEKKEAQLQLQAADAFKKNVFIGFLTLGLAALFYVYYALRKKNTVISQQNELNEQTIAILSHDIKEPLLGVKLMLKKLNKEDPFVAQAAQIIEGQVNAVNGILTNLLKMKKVSLLKKDKNTKADVNTVVKNVIQELNVAIQTKSLTIENELTDDLTLPIAAEKLQIIVHNLLSNAVKYSFSHQKIRIFQEGKGFCIQDFGVGLSPEQRSKLMREVTASERGTNKERGNGLGLFLIGTMLQGEQLKVVFDTPEVGGTIAKVLS